MDHNTKVIGKITNKVDMALKFGKMVVNMMVIFLKI